MFPEFHLVQCVRCAICVCVNVCVPPQHKVLNTRPEIQVACRCGALWAEFPFFTRNGICVSINAVVIPSRAYCTHSASCPRRSCPILHKFQLRYVCSLRQAHFVCHLLSAYEPWMYRKLWHLATHAQYSVKCLRRGVLATFGAFETMSCDNFPTFI